MTELLSFYLGSMIGHLSHMAPSAGTITTTTVACLEREGLGGGG